MQSKHIAIVVVVLLIAVGGYFFLRGDRQSSTSALISAPTAVSEKVKKPTGAPTAGVTEINVVGTEFSFNPSRIRVRAGERIKITFKNNGRAPHNFILEGLDIGTKIIGAGQIDVVEFVAPASGTYTFFCSVAGHRTAGMKGSLKVE